MKDSRNGNHIPIDERFDLLRRIDTRRRWQSLDDERVCLLCERKFAGRHVEFRRNRSGQVELHCPTDGCDGSSQQWVYPNDPRLAAMGSPRATGFFGLAMKTGTA